MNRTFCGMAVIAAAALTGGCGLLPDAFTSCQKQQPYQTAEQAAALRVPAGSDLPDTRNALRIPEVKSPERPADSEACIDHPPSYGAARPKAG